MSRPVTVLPGEVHDLIIRFTAERSLHVRQRFEEPFDSLVLESTRDVPEPLYEHTLFDRAQLAVLRLVSRSYYQTASSLLFRRIDITEHVTSLPYRSMEDFTAVCSFSEGDHARHVHELVIGIRGWAGNNTGAMLSSYHGSMLRVLLKLLQAFTRLQILTIVGPELTQSITIASPRSQASARQVICMLRVFTPHLLFTATHRSIARNSPFRAAINQAPLMVESFVMDWQTCYFPEADRVIRTDAQRYFSDSLYEHYLFSFIAETTSLKHLCIRYGNKRKILLDLLDYSGLVHLKILELGGVQVTFENLKGLLSNNVDTLRTVDLQLMELRTGGWEDIYGHLETFQALTYLYVERCSYI